ncbi:hypothetical protein BTVI_00357 [Pitangus sulphuratus]|nr:hypothetical protein BTVI_00357 [Pitangus sulphuratus]
MKTELDTAPTLGETLKATQQVKIGKAAGVDGIPPEIWEHGGQALHAKCWGENNYEDMDYAFEKWKNTVEVEATFEEWRNKMVKTFDQPQ